MCPLPEASVNNDIPRESQPLGYLNDMNIDNISRRPSQAQSKELAPPPVDPFSSSSGMYIPPEETRQADLALDEVMGWGLSDFQQDTEEEEDDDMDDNEFDMDFEDAEYLPPIKQEYPSGVCSRHMSQLNLNGMQYAPYAPPQNSLPYPAFVNRESAEQAMGIDNSAPPVKYINPSSLQLQNGWAAEPENHIDSLDTGNAAENASFVNTPPSSTNGSPTTSPKMKLEGEGPSMSSDARVGLNGGVNSDINSTAELGNGLHEGMARGLGPQDLTDLSTSGIDLGLSDIDLDMDIDELYPLPQIDIANGQHEVSNTEPRPEVAAEPVEAEVKPMPKAELRSLSPETSVEPTPEHTPEHTQSRRKTPRRKTVSHRPTASSSSHSSTHVCNMTYPDGSGCHRSFTRPYDLARHQETLHAAVRKMYTCEVCGENSKTFSRLDALSRHMRLKHS